MAEAICSQIDPELWFPGSSGAAAPAKRICVICPVVSPCLVWALETNQEFGVWGGLSEGELRRMRRARKLRLLT